MIIYTIIASNAFTMDYAMPELPEVETTIQAIKNQSVLGKTIHNVQIYETRLRWQIDSNALMAINKQRIHHIHRRAKYIIIILDTHCLLIHLGMSGRLCFVPLNTSLIRHDHVDFNLVHGILRFNDPRRFGCIISLPSIDAWLKHPLLSHLGPEPLAPECNEYWFFEKSRKKTIAIKQLIMNAQFVVGVGNIYASESLFQAKIHPQEPAGSLSLDQYKKLHHAIVDIISRAIQKGGSSIKNFTSGNKNPGTFQQQLCVYARQNQLCLQCGSIIQKTILGQRSTYFCPSCQPLQND